MKHLQIYIIRLFLYIFLYSTFEISAVTVSLCQSHFYDIKCDLEKVIVITDSKIGHLRSLDQTHKNHTNFCQKSDSYLKINSSDCFKSVRRLLTNQCTGRTFCRVSVTPAIGLISNEVICKMFDDNLFPKSLYITYDCVSKELFFESEQMNDIHYLGGYMSSVGYNLQKISNRDAFSALKNTYRNRGLPITKVFRPKISTELGSDIPIVFQFEIIENSISLKENPVSVECQIGKLYTQDYYEFVPTNGSKNINDIIQQFSICPTKSGIIGQKFGPIIANEINIRINLNLSTESDGVLLIKFTTIFCPSIVLENANVVYNHVVNVGNELVVYGIAIIECKNGFFFQSLSMSKSSYDSKTVECDHVIGSWKDSSVTEQCVKRFPTYTNYSSLPSTVGGHTTTETSTMRTYSQPGNVTTTELFPYTDLRSILIVVIGSLTLLAVIFVLIWKYWKRIRDSVIMWTSLMLTVTFDPYWFESDYVDMHNTRYLEGKFPELPRDSDRSSLLSESKSTINRDNSSKYESELLLAGIQLDDDDELPTKEPKQSTIGRLKRATGSLRHSLQMKLYQKPILRESSHSDSYSGSKIQLLPLPRIYPDNSSSIRESENESSIAITEVDDIYLEPKGTLALPSVGEVKQVTEPGRRHDDYMIYDMSQASSIEPQSPGTTSLSLSNGYGSNDSPNSKFAMESNHYYGLGTGTGAPTNTNIPVAIISSLNPFEKNCDCETCVYETIDDDNEKTGSLSRKMLPLPSPPSK